MIIYTSIVFTFLLGSSTTAFAVAFKDLEVGKRYGVSTEIPAQMECKQMYAGQVMSASTTPIKVVPPTFTRDASESQFGATNVELTAREVIKHPFFNEYKLTFTVPGFADLDQGQVCSATLSIIKVGASTSVEVDSLTND